ncbi:MAG: twin-arginine translocase TatA/TatE family subunit [Acidobacteria bacterium]|nr:MAG: twin-arginine translocase TatA/TatE family subunit [Acidobacteriota bacterium]REK11609.1 MAG: twin-arginine translocase TatA/TatE family subunit [Acidobacteriota bacterium]
MFGTLGMQEILLLMAVALLIFGPKRLPEIGRTLGKAMGEFRRATTDLKRTLDYEVEVDDSTRQKTRGLPVGETRQGSATGSESGSPAVARGSGGGASEVTPGASGGPGDDAGSEPGAATGAAARAAD